MNDSTHQRDWNPPEPAASDTFLAVFLAFVGGAALLAWIAVPSLIRGATRSHELLVQERQAEIDQVVASRTESQVTRDDVNK